MTIFTPSPGSVRPQAVKAEGVHIEDETGKSWIDGCSGAIACSIGYGHPEIVAAMHRQAQTTSFLYRTQFTSTQAEWLASRLCSKLGYEAAFFVNSGSEAVEGAIRLARQYWQGQGKPEKRKILSRRISYHGTTASTLGLSGHWQRRRGAGNNITGTPGIHTPYCLRCPLGHQPDSCGLACADMFENEILSHGSEYIAAIVLEPITGASGAAIVPPSGYLKRIRAICERHDILLIADEILTGLGRTGKWLALDHEGIEADILCIGKGLNAGYFPISAILAKQRIHAVLVEQALSYSYGHTHSNHPVGASVANAVLDVLEENSLVDRAAFMGKYLFRHLQSIASSSNIIGDLRGCGMLWGLELVMERERLEPFPASLKAAEYVTELAFRNGLIVYPASGFIAGSSGDAIIIAPPFTISEEEIDALCRRLSTTLKQAETELAVKIQRRKKCLQLHSNQV